MPTAVDPDISALLDDLRAQLGLTESGMSVAELLASMPRQEREELIRAVPEDLLAQAVRSWRWWARPKQLEPPGDDWWLWVLAGGRGSGKSRPGSEWVLDRSEAFARASAKHRVHLIGRTAADVRDVMIEGDSGLLACAERRGYRPLYEPSKRRFTIAELDTVATAFSAERPDSLRGPQCHTAWADEVASWVHKVDGQGNSAWTNMVFGLRLAATPDDWPEDPDGQLSPLPENLSPRACATTTPKPIQLVKDWFDDHSGLTVITQQSLYENRANLASTFIELILARYKNSALAAQEILGLLVMVVEGALWRPEKINHVQQHPDLAEIVIGVDPPAEFTAECGIIVVGGEAGVADDWTRNIYVLDDRSMRGASEEWGQQVVAAYHAWRTQGYRTTVVAEVNQGGDMVRGIVNLIDPSVHVTKVRAGKGQSKWARAEPVAAVYGDGRAHHVGYFGDLESQMVTWVEGDPNSPDRMDALCWAVWQLLPSISLPISQPVSAARVALPAGVSQLTRRR